MGAGRVRARRGSGSIRVRNGRLLAQVSLGTDPSGRRVRRGKTFDSRTHAEAWIARQQLEHRQLTNPVTDDRLADYLRWWLTVEAPKGKPGRRPLARSTLAHYRVVVEHHLIPELGNRKVGRLTVRELDAFASRKLAAGYAPATVNRMRETLRSALSTAVRQDRLIRNVAATAAGSPHPDHPSTGSPTTSSPCCSRPPATSTSSRSSYCSPAPACASGRPAACAGATSTSTSMPPRLTVVWQLDRWDDLVPPKTAASRRTIPLRAEVAAELETWRHRQQQRTADGFDNVHGLVFTTRNGRPIDQRNVSRAFHRARTTAGVDHGSLKTFRSTVATQLADAGLHPSKTQAFLGHAHVTTTMTYYTAITNVDEAAALLPDLH